LISDDSNFAYILDLDSNSYTQVNLSTSPSGLASRYGHSGNANFLNKNCTLLTSVYLYIYIYIKAVLMNNSLFIMFGKSNGQLTNEIDMIDVSNSDPTTIQWSSVYPPVQETVNHSGGKTSAGTIAGATVGSVVGVSATI
jgi:hypothetical protein